jgi:hypothetical protein
MKKRFLLVAVPLVLLSAGCLTFGKPKVKDPNIKIYSADLNGDGVKENIEANDLSASGSGFQVTVKSSDKAAKTIDSFSVPGRITALELADFNNDGKTFIVVYFVGKDQAYNAAVYKLVNNDTQLSKIFSASSVYGVVGDFDAIPRMRVGRAAKNKATPVLAPEWDSWVWNSEKFILESAQPTDR